MKTLIIVLLVLGMFHANIKINEKSFIFSWGNNLQYNCNNFTINKSHIIVYNSIVRVIEMLQKNIEK